MDPKTATSAITEKTIYLFKELDWPAFQPGVCPHGEKQRRWVVQTLQTTRVYIFLMPVQPRGVKVGEVMG